MNIDFHKNAIIQDIATKLARVYDFSIEKELNNLIPDELGSMKSFFIQVISSYYEKLHPVVWCQILVAILKGWFVDLPFAPDETFAFISKSLLLNSGPFILKILQTIRPALSEELKNKYQLNNLIYPGIKSKPSYHVIKQNIGQ